MQLATAISSLGHEPSEKTDALLEGRSKTRSFTFCAANCQLGLIPIRLRKSRSRYRALDRSADRSDVFGSYLVEKGLITQQQLARALQHQKRAKVAIGRLGYQEGMLSLDDISAVLIEQSQIKKLFGEIAVAQGFLTVEQVDRLLDLQTRTAVPLGEILVQLQLLDFELVLMNLEEYLALVADGKADNA